MWGRDVCSACSRHIYNKKYGFTRTTHCWNTCCILLYLGYFAPCSAGSGGVQSWSWTTLSIKITNQRRSYVNQASPSGSWKSFIQGNKVSAYIAAGPDHWSWRTNEVKWEWHCASLLVAAQGVNWRAQSHGRLHYGDRRQLWAGGAISWEPRVTQTAGWAHTIR